MQKPSYGVLVARCQVHELHEGHLWLFNEVKARNSRVIIFLGVKPIGATYKNPLDFETRRAMIQAIPAYKDFNILPLPDMPTDEAWSKVLDGRIRELCDYGEVTLYGSLDSFTKHYTGSFTPVELTMPHDLRSINGTEIRAGLTNQIIASADFRAGVIHAITNLRPQVKATVDIVITTETLLSWSHPGPDAARLTRFFLLGQKPGETCWRFIGGFSEPTTPSYEFDAAREAMEETGLPIEDLKYIGSTLVPDWRWAGEPDQIKTLVFVGTSMTMGGKANDDIAKVKWVKASELSESLFSDVHKPIWHIVKKHFNL